MYRIVTLIIVTLAFAQVSFADSDSDIFKKTQNTIEQTRAIQEAHAKEFSKDVDIIFKYHEQKLEDAKQFQKEWRNLFTQYHLKNQAYEARIDSIDVFADMIDTFSYDLAGYKRPRNKAMRITADLDSSLQPHMLTYKGSIYNNREDVISALRNADLFFTEIVVRFNQFVRPTALNNIKLRLHDGAVECNVLSLKMLGGERIARWARETSEFIPAVLKSKPLIAALKMEAEAKVLYDTHKRYLSEIKLAESKKVQGNHAELFTEGENIDYNEITINLP